MTTATSNSNRPRVLVVAHACHPDENMETRIGWRRAIAASKKYDTTVIHSTRYDSRELAWRAADFGVNGDSLRFVPIGSKSMACLQHFDGFYYIGYRAWQRAALRCAKKLHGQHPFDLVHQVTYCGYREPGNWWRLGIPLVWGPVGGTQNFPTRFLSQLDTASAVRELVRNQLNHWQLNHDRRVRSAARNAVKVLTATSTAQRDVERATGVACQRLLETAIEPDFDFVERELDASRPFRILWSGRLRAWKALPMLLHALHQLPSEVRYELRVMGVGASEARWKRLAKRLHIDQHVEWIGWPDYRDSVAQYAWADAFVFTSLRDTSGTGLLESLAAGTPIIGVDHQGAHDIMTSECALPVAVTEPRETIEGFASAIHRLVADPQLWRRLSSGAQRRSLHYTWDRLSSEIDNVYGRILRGECIVSATVASAKNATDKNAADKQATERIEPKLARSSGIVGIR